MIKATGPGEAGFRRGAVRSNWPARRYGGASSHDLLGICVEGANPLAPGRPGGSWCEDGANGLAPSNGVPVVGISTGTFNIYKGGSVMGDGTHVFSETHTNLVTDVNGVFSATIGSISNMTLAALADGTTSNRYIEAVINGQTLLPRQQMVSVPFAAVAGNAQVVTAWTNFTPSFRNSNDETLTEGEGGVRTGRWRRVGEMMEVTVYIAFGSNPITGTPSKPWLFGLPCAYLVDFSKIAHSDAFPIGVGQAYDTNGSIRGFYACQVVSYQLDNVALSYDALPADNRFYLDKDFPFVVTSGNELRMSYSVPIVGWDVTTPHAQLPCE